MMNPAPPSPNAAPEPLRHALADLPSRVGGSLGSSPWVEVRQERIDAFAQATGDRQWIHVDPARAAAGPFGRTVAHGFLTLSLLPVMAGGAFRIEGGRMAVNYGLNRLRFPAPVPMDSRVRGHFQLQSCEAFDGGWQLTLQVTVEREGGDKPVCVAEWLVRHFT